MPMIAFIGVRSSWLTLARNSSLARLACSAATRAARFFNERDVLLGLPLDLQRHSIKIDEHRDLRRAESPESPAS